MLNGIENGSIDRPASYDAALTRAKTYRKDGKMVGELIHVRERSTEAAYVTKSEEVKTKAPKQSSRRIPLRSPRKWP